MPQYEVAIFTTCSSSHRHLTKSQLVLTQELTCGKTKEGLSDMILGASDSEVNAGSMMAHWYSVFTFIVTLF